MRRPRRTAIVLLYAVYGACIENGVVTDAAPIARWAIGKTENEFFGWVHGKGGSVEAYG